MKQFQQWHLRHDALSGLDQRWSGDLFSTQSTLWYWLRPFYESPLQNKTLLNVSKSNFMGVPSMTVKKYQDSWLVNMQKHICVFLSLVYWWILCQNTNWDLVLCACCVHFKLNSDVCADWKWRQFRFSSWTLISCCSAFVESHFKEHLFFRCLSGYSKWCWTKKPHFSVFASTLCPCSHRGMSFLALSWCQHKHWKRPFKGNLVWRFAGKWEWTQKLPHK